MTETTIFLKIALPKCIHVGVVYDTSANVTSCSAHVTTVLRGKMCKTNPISDDNCHF